MVALLAAQKQDIAKTNLFSRSLSPSVPKKLDRSSTHPKKLRISSAKGVRRQLCFLTFPSCLGIYIRACNKTVILLCNRRE
jgi:hypothetical protein